MRKFILGFLLFLTINSFAQTPVAQYGFLNVEGTQLVGANGRPAILHGVSFGWHNFWPRFYNPKAVEWLAKDWGISVVRAAIGAEPKNGYIDNPAFAVKKALASSDEG